MSKTAIKVMYLADSYENPFAGTEGQLQMLINGLDREEFDPHMTLLRHSDYISKHGFGCPVKVLGVGSMASLSSISKIYKFSSELRKSGFKLVHIFFNDSSIIAPLFLKLKGIKVIISRRDMGYWYTAATQTILKFNSIFVDHAIVNSLAVKEITMRKENLSAEKITVIYNGYEDEATTSQESEDVYTSNGIAESDLVIGLVANIRPLKRIEDAIKAMPIILNKFPNAKFVHVGGGDNSELRSLAESLGVSDSVIFLGQQKYPKVYMRRFDVAILCSESEGFSNAIIEYMKCRNPVICTDVGGNSEIVLDGETGYLIKMGDIDALANKVITLFSNPILMKQFSESAYNIANNKYSKQAMIESHTLIYKNIVC